MHWEFPFSVEPLYCSRKRAGCSRYCFQTLEKLAMVTPSMTRWSADQLTLITYAFTTSSLSLKRGTALVLPIAPMATWGAMMQGCV